MLACDVWRATARVRTNEGTGRRASGHAVTPLVSAGWRGHFAQKSITNTSSSTGLSTPPKALWSSWTR